MRQLPISVLNRREAAHLEMLLLGGYPPLGGFLAPDEARSVRERGVLPDGRTWPTDVALHVDASLGPAIAENGRLVLADVENTPLAWLEVTDSAPADGSDGSEALRVGGPVHPLRPPAVGAFRRLWASAADVRRDMAGVSVLAVLPSRPLRVADVRALAERADALNARLLVLPRVAMPEPPLLLDPQALVRTILAVAPDLPAGTLVHPLPLPTADHRDVALQATVAAAYGASALVVLDARDDDLGTTPIPVELSSAGPGQPDARAITALLDHDAPLPPGVLSQAVERELRRAHPPLARRGLVLLFSGLSGSGKSTVARRVHELLGERSPRTVTLLDGDAVRQMLSAGLGFSRADRVLNVRRIGYVAAEISRHGGTAVCAPIAPYAGTRAEVRAMVTEAGGAFVLIYVATPLEVCEARDRKGLYALARAGKIPEFTGISDPYDEPTDAELVIDTSVEDVDACAERVWQRLRDGGWV